MLIRLLLPLLTAPAVIAANATIRVDLSKISASRIDPQLFGSYQEEHWSDITPGVYEQYLVNPSFEPWYDTGDPRKAKTRLVFQPVQTRGVAYPWEPWGTEATWSLSKPAFNSHVSQRVDVRDGSAGVIQQLALPDYRIDRYRVRVFVRATGNIRLRIVLLAGSDGTEILSESPIAATESWSPAEVELSIEGRLAETHLHRYGIARLGLIADGTGSAWWDQATLFPADAVEGVYNPDTLAHLAHIRPAAVRWPGGNFTSGYHWRDGIGPVERRPSIPNRAWGGTVANHVGTDEWLRFCELAGLEPVMGVGFGEITVQEAADWVEYCNGSIDTPMGALRAANGHAKPYRVKYWGVGNEVYGSHQIGNTDAVTYADGFVAMANAMKARDPSIVLIASALAVDRHFRGQYPEWNRTVLERAGHVIDLFDTHHYIRPNVPDAEVVPRSELLEVRRALLGSHARLEAYYDTLRTLLAARKETRHIGAVHYEWGVIPTPPTGIVPPPPTYGAARQTFFNALATAAHYHAFFRHCDLVKGAMLHNFSFYVNPSPANSEPVNPRTEISRLYRGFAGARPVATSYKGPTYDVAGDYRDIGPLHDMPEIDTVSLLTDDGRLHVCMLNRNLELSRKVDVHIENAASGGPSWSLTRLQSDRPYDEQTWANPGEVYRTETVVVPNEHGKASVTLPPVSLGILTLALDGHGLERSGSQSAEPNK